MKSESRLLVLAALGLVIVAMAGAQDRAVRLDQQEAPARIPIPISLELSDGGIRFPDGSVQSTKPGGVDPPCYDVAHRFVDCNNGTVTDTRTDLIWLEDQTCLGTPETYADANATVLAFSETGCGTLTDGSQPGDWRLPTAAEWRTLINPSCLGGPRIVGNQTPITFCFEDSPWATGVASGTYWTSTTDSVSASRAMGVQMTSGVVYDASKGVSNYVWPVRGNARQD